MSQPTRRLAGGITEEERVVLGRERLGAIEGAGPILVGRVVGVVEIPDRGGPGVLRITEEPDPGVLGVVDVGVVSELGRLGAGLHQPTGQGDVRRGLPRGAPTVEPSGDVHVDHRGVVDDRHRGDLTKPVFTGSGKKEPEGIGKSIAVGVGERPAHHVAIGSEDELFSLRAEVVHLDEIRERAAGVRAQHRIKVRRGRAKPIGTPGKEVAHPVVSRGHHAGEPLLVRRLKRDRLLEEAILSEPLPVEIRGGGGDRKARLGRGEGR